MIIGSSSCDWARAERYRVVVELVFANAKVQPASFSVDWLGRDG